MQSVPQCTRKRHMKKNDDPADTSSNISIRGERALHSSNTSNLNGDKSAPYQIDVDVYEHLPKMYQKMAAVFAASGKVVIINNTSRGSRNE